MRNTIRKLCIVSTCLVLVLACVISIRSYTDEEETVVYENFESEESETNETFTTMDKEGNIVELDIDTMEAEVAEEIAEKEALGSTAIGGTTNLTYGVVNFRTKSSSSENTTYTNIETGESGYLNGYYATNGAFLGYSSDGTQVKFVVAGVTGWVDADEVEVLDYEDEDTVKSVDFYRVESGKLYHYTTSNVKQSYYSGTTLVGYKQSYMESNTVYYSYDGHYFYTTYAQMIKDYQNDTRDNSINPDDPYYNYYQYLSHRSTTNLTADMLDAYTEDKVGSTTSVMIDMGEYFIYYQNIYGANALLMYAVAANESAYGTSSIALSKNNLFGHSAYDSSLGTSADRYDSAQLSIYSHARYFVSEGYLDPEDYYGRYYGGHLGDKASGMNVKYASDPYWGEKAAAICWHVYGENTDTEDSSKYTIGIKDGGFNLYVRKSASTSSTALYSTGKCGSYPFIILGTVSGTSVNGNTTWYKIQSDATLENDRSAIVQDAGEYDFDTFYAYVSSEYVTIVSEATSDEDEDATYDPGDVNGDGSVSSADYVAIKNYIMGTKALSSSALKRADVNEDGSVNAKDYVAIKNHIMGTKLLF